ncbi:MAG: succinate-semialdehyde dehydrogenase [Bacteroidia bacterium]|nr:MAG: succinate-semialdehyde dehydrogenase [Bacteroidia bacterium]
MSLVSEMVEKARVAQAIFERDFDQARTDEVVRAIAKVVFDNAEMLAKEAVEETRMGVYEDKVAKNRGKSKGIWYDLKGKKSMGLVEVDPVTELQTYFKPVGVVAAITPTTNPIVTPMSKCMFSLKCKNAIIVAPHPRSKGCSGHTIDLINAELKKLGCPENLVQIIREPSIDATQELMKSCDVVLATGGMGMVKAAYSSGKPSYGVGAGNVQVIMDRDIDFDKAAKTIITGRIFDNGIICSGEQSFIYPKEKKNEVFEAFKKNGAFFIADADRDKVVNAIFEDGHIAGDVVGQSVQFIAKKAGVSVPAETKVLVIEAKGVGAEDLVAKEKMCPVLAAFAYDKFEEAIEIAKTNLANEGNGHSAGIHSNNEEHIKMVGAALTVSRVVLNAPVSTTAGGAMGSGLATTNTLGCGTWGNNTLSENLTAKHLVNTTRVARLNGKTPIPTDDELWQL